MSTRFLCARAAVLCALVSVAGKAEATTITFEAAINGTLALDDPSNPYDNCQVVCFYAKNLPVNEGVFTTQEYRFTALTNGGPGDHGLGTVVEPSLLGIADNGTDWLLAGGIVQMTRADGGAFSLLSFQAANIDPTDPTVGQFIRALGFKSGVGFQVLHFDLNTGPGFQTFVLPSSWTGLSSVNFSGRFASDDGNPRVTAIDNINVASVPEPVSLVLLGSGLVMVARRRFQARE